MSNDLDQYCRDYLDDALSPAERTRFEQRLAGGDKDLIEALNRQKSFRSSMSGSEKEQQKNTGAQASLFEDDQSELLNFVTGSPQQPEEREQPKPPNQEKKSSSEKKKSKTKTPPPPVRETNNVGEDEENIFDTAREKSTLIERKWVKIIISLLFLGLAVLLIYSTWQNYLMENKVSVMQERQRLADTEISRLERNLRTTDFQLGRVLDIMRSDFTTLNIITTEHEKLKRWVQLWDKGTLRSAVVLQEPDLSADEELQLWSYNLRDRMWQKAGTIDYAISDSIYTQWSSSDLARSYRLRVILFNKKDSTERVLGTQRVY